MGKNIFSEQHFNTTEVLKLQKKEDNEQADIHALKMQKTSSIFAENNEKSIHVSSIKSNNTNKINDTIAPTLAFGLTQQNTASVEKIQAAKVQQTQISGPVQGVSGSSSIFLGGNTPSTLVPSSNDRTSIFTNAEKIGGYALYNKLDTSYKAHKLTEEEIAAQKGLTGEKRTNPKPYNAKVELETNPYAAFSEADPEFLREPDALEMLNPKNWFRKNK